MDRIAWIIELERHPAGKEREMLTQEEQAKARKIQADLARNLDTLRADTMLSAAGRAAKMATAVLAAREDMASLRAASDARAEAAQAKAYKAAFGISKTDATGDRAYRDGLAASVPDHAVAGWMLSAAIARGDTTAIVALAEYAWSRRDDPLAGDVWDSIVGQAAGSSPVLDASLVALRSASEPDKVARFKDRIATQVLQPRDLQGSLEFLARGAAPRAGSPAFRATAS
jgi:hypothetical protein